MVAKAPRSECQIETLSEVVHAEVGDATSESSEMCYQSSKTAIIPQRAMPGDYVTIKTYRRRSAVFRVTY